MKKVAVIPARGGSKRIPRKNVRLFLGKPIISYAIETALDSNVFDSVVVSTDDDQIKEIAISCGAEVPFMRPPELSDDYVGTNDVVKHAIGELNLSPKDMVACLYATTPLMKSEYIVQAERELMSGQAAYAFSVTSFAFPFQRGLFIDPVKGISPIYPEHIFTRSQDLPEAYHDAGQFYLGWCESYIKDVVVFSSASIPILLPRHLVQDIDTLEDWERAEAMYAAVNSVVE